MKKLTKAKNLLKNISYSIVFLLMCTTIIFLICSLFQLKGVVAVAVHKSVATSWNGDSALIEGEYTLTQDVQLTQKMTIETGHSVTLALNGYTIERANESATIEVQEGASLTIQKTIDNVTSKATNNSIVDNLNLDTPFFTVENATCILKDITIDANFLAIKSTINVENVKFRKEITLRNCKAEFKTSIIEDKINILDGTEISFSSLKKTMRVEFKSNSNIYLENSRFVLKNTFNPIRIPNITIAGQKNDFEIQKCTIEKFIYQNAEQSTIICEESEFYYDILFNGDNNSFKFNNVTFGGNAKFTGENHIFRFQNIKTNTTTISIESKRIQELENNDICIEFINVEQIDIFIYKENTLYPQISGLKIEYFIATEATIIIEGQDINAMNYSNFEIENFVFTTNIIATLNENTLLKDKNLYFLSDVSSQDNFCIVTVGYNIENKVMLGRGVEFNFAENGRIKDVDFINGATPADYKEYIEAGKLTDVFLSSSDTANKKFNLTKGIIIILSIVIIDMLIVWGMLILVLKRNKKQ